MLDAEADTLSVRGSDPSSTALRVPHPGDVIAGKYEVIGILGEGGVGVVLEVEHMQLHERRALKLLRSEGKSAASQSARLLREAQIMTRLRSDHVAHVYDTGVLPDGTTYIVMERLFGETVAQALEARGKYPIADAVKLVITVCEALEEAHDAGLIHRDIKPSNLFLARKGDEPPVLKVIDFGLAKDLENPSHLTASDSVLGSPAYMAPEQIRSPSDVDARADVWALGVLLHELLAGAPPFTGPTAAATLANIVSEDAKPLEGLPPGLADIIRKCLARDRQARFSAARDVSTALRRCADPNAAAAWTPSSDRPVAAARRMWPVVVGGSSLALVALGFAAISLRPRSPASQPAASVSLASSAVPRASASGFSFHASSPRRLTFTGACDEYPVFTPDGQAVVFDHSVGDDSFISVMRFRDRSTEQLTHGSGYDYQAAVSPDGTRIAFRRGPRSGVSGVYTIPLDGSTEPHLLAASVYRPSWTKDARSLWVDDRSHFLRVDASSGATLETIDPPVGMRPGRTSELDNGTLVAQFPHYRDTRTGGVGVYGKDRTLNLLLTGDIEEALAVTGDGQTALVSRVQTAAQPELLAVPLDGSPASSLASSGVAPSKGIALAPDGRAIVWSTCRSAESLGVLAPDGKLTAFAADAEEWSDRALSWIPGTTLVAALSTRGGRSQPWILDRNGAAPPRAIELGIDGDVGSIAASPDRATLALGIDERGISVVPVAGGHVLALTHGKGDTAPSFTRDGKEIVYTEHGEKGTQRIMSIPVGGGESVMLLDGGRDAATSPTDDRIALFLGNSGTTLVPSIAPLHGGTAHPLSPLLGPGDYAGIHFSPDGKRVGLLRGGHHFVEVDVATKRITRDVDVNGEVTFCEYVAAEVMCVHQQWLGGLWMADTTR